MPEQIVNSQQSFDAYKAYLDDQWEQYKYLRLTLKTGRQRTGQQNKAIHVYCELMAEALNDAGLDMVTVLAPGTEIPWTADKVKEDMWRAVQIPLIGKTSTTKLERAEVSQVYDVINRHIGSKFGIFVEFPSKDRD